MDKSFSMHFAPISNTKTISQYEEEIKGLQEDNFKLKHENIELKKTKDLSPETMKLLRDSDKSIKVLQDKNKKLQMEHFDNLNAFKNKIKNLEDENLRLISCLETLNEENNKIKNTFSDEEKQNLILKNKDLHKLIEELQEQNRNLEELTRNSPEKNYLKEKEIEIINFKKYCEELQVELEKKNSMNNELNCKNVQLGEELEMNENELFYLKEKLDDIERKLRHFDNENEDLQYKVRELEEYKSKTKNKTEEIDLIKRNFHFLKNEYHQNLIFLISQMDLQSTFIQKLKARCNFINLNLQNCKIKETFISKLKELKYQLNEYKEKFYISQKNIDFLGSINLNNSDSLERIVSQFYKMYFEMVNKIKSMENEIGQITLFAESNKNQVHTRTLKLLDNFSKEFNLAKKDLEDCQKYLVKKNLEIKEIKRNNLEAQHRNKFLERKKQELQDKVERLENKTNETLIQLKNKNELLSKLKGRVGAYNQ